MSVTDHVLGRLDDVEGKLRDLGAEVQELRALVTRAGEGPAPAPVPPVARAADPPPPQPVVVTTEKSQRPAWTPPPQPMWSPPKDSVLRLDVAELARKWELLGPRGFAIVGGAVTAFGIILLSVLAANRGWITPAMRVGIGAVASVTILGAGVWVRARYGQLLMSLGAAGAGIAGGYATLAAAAARYDLVPDWLALPLAAVIAATAIAVAIAWSSEIVAAIGLLGAALAPALQAVDVGMTWTSAAFALIVFAAAIAVAVPKRWRNLLVAVALIVVAQIAWLVTDVSGDADAGTIAVAAALVLTVLAAGLAWQLTVETLELDSFAMLFLGGAVGVALLVTPQLFTAGHDRGLLLAGAAGVWAVAWAALRPRRPAVGLVLGVSSLTLAAVATADTLSGTALTVAWAAESVLFTILAWRLLDARLQLTALAYTSLAAIYAIGHDAPPRTVFHDPVDGSLAFPVAAVALAVLAAGLLAPAHTEPRTESGLLAWLQPVRELLAARRAGLRELLVFAATALGTYAAALALIGAWFRQGHLAAVMVAALVGCVVTGVSARRGSTNLLVAGFGWLTLLFAEAIAFEVPEFSVDVVHRSYGGWALLAAAAGLLAGAFVFQLVYATPGWGLVPASAGVLSLASATAGLALVSPAHVDASEWAGWRLPGAALVYLVLSASVFRVARHRDLASVFWGLALAAVLEIEWLVIDDLTWRAVAFAATAAVAAALARLLREERLWLAGLGVAVATGAATIVGLALQWIIDGAEPRRYAIAALAVAVVLGFVAALGWRKPGRRDLVTAAWAVGFVALVLGESFLVGGGRPAAFAAALTAGLVAPLAARLGETLLWWAGAVVTGIVFLVVIEWVTPLKHFLTASEHPATGIWVLAACLAAGVVVAATAPLQRTAIGLGVAVVTLYAISLGILELAERAFGGSVTTNFERGHVGVSSFWSLIGLALLVVGLARGSTLLRFGGLAVFGLSLAKIFVYDLSALSSVARAFSFIAVGALVLAGGFFLQRLSAGGRSATST